MHETKLIDRVIFLARLVPIGSAFVVTLLYIDAFTACTTILDVTTNVLIFRLVRSVPPLISKT